MNINQKYLYIFIDESGNYDFSKKGTEYFTLSSITCTRPFNIFNQMLELKYEIIEHGTELEYFHASEDKQNIRDKVFDILRDNIDDLRIDSVIAEKRKTYPTLQNIEKFYPMMMRYLLNWVIKRQKSDYTHILIFIDSIPVKKKRRVIEKSLKLYLKNLPFENISYRLFFHDSKSNFGLQVVDYCNWAIFRKWSRGDRQSYDLIREGIKSAFDIFAVGREYFY